jgi:hypothetical protein
MDYVWLSALRESTNRHFGGHVSSGITIQTPGNLIHFDRLRLRDRRAREENVIAARRQLLAPASADGQRCLCAHVA